LLDSSEDEEDEHVDEADVDILSDVLIAGPVSPHQGDFTPLYLMKLGPLVKSLYSGDRDKVVKAYEVMRGMPDQKMKQVVDRLVKNVRGRNRRVSVLHLASIAKYRPELVAATDILELLPAPSYGPNELKACIRIIHDVLAHTDDLESGRHLVPMVVAAFENEVDPGRSVTILGNMSTCYPGAISELIKISTVVHFIQSGHESHQALALATNLAGYHPENAAEMMSMGIMDNVEVMLGLGIFVKECAWLVSNITVHGNAQQCEDSVLALMYMMMHGHHVVGQKTIRQLSEDVHQRILCSFYHMAGDDLAFCRKAVTNEVLDWLTDNLDPLTVFILSALLEIGERMLGGAFNPFLDYLITSRRWVLIWNVREEIECDRLLERWFDPLRCPQKLLVKC
jgi:hypothetical protein